MQQRAGNRTAITDDVNEFRIVEDFVEKPDSRPPGELDKQSAARSREHGLYPPAHLPPDSRGHVRWGEIPAGLGKSIGMFVPKAVILARTDSLFEKAVQQR